MIQLRGDMVLLGYETKVSAKGNKYTQVLLQSGADFLKCLAEPDVVLNSLTQYKPYEFAFSYNSGYKDLRLVKVVGEVPNGK